MDRLRVSVSEDRMSASVSGMLPSGAEWKDARKGLMKSLSDVGVSFGVADELVDAAAGELLKKGRLESTVVAVGRYPERRKSSGAHFTVPVYQRSLFPEGFGDYGNSPVLWAHAAEFLTQPSLVEKGQEVGAVTRGEPQKEGVDVFGRRMRFSEGHAPKRGVLHLEAGLRRDKNSEKVFADATGILIRDGLSCYLQPVRRNGAFSVETAQEKMRAIATLYPAGPGGRNPSRDELVGELRRMKIAGERIDNEAIDKAVRELPSLKRGGVRVPVARGVDAVPGRDGWIEYLVNLSFSHAPRVEPPGGKADYYHIHAFEKVRRGQQLARLHPPEKGTAGVDVFGETVEAPRGKALRAALGKNVGQSREDKRVLVAECDGHVYLRNDRLVVEQVLRIEGDLEYHTGNVEYRGDVVVTGDVRAGFAVWAEGNVEVGGAVEDARIEAGGHVVVHAGFAGQGRGSIRAGGDVVVSFVRNQRIVAGNDIMVAGECMDAGLSAGGSILVESRRSRIAGGDAVARDSIRTRNLGSSPGVTTRVKAGVASDVMDTIDRLELKRQKLVEEVESTEKTIQGFAVDEADRGGLTSSESMVRTRMYDLSGRLNEKLEEVSAELDRLKARGCYREDGFVEALETVHPNVLVTVAGSTFVVREKMHRCRFVLRDGAIAVVKTDATRGSK